MPVVDADDQGTWPSPFADLVAQLADEADLDDLDNYQDLDLDEYEAGARELLRGYVVRARHCTRLLDHEVDAVRAQGLRLLNLELINERLTQAREQGLLTEGEFATLRADNCLTQGAVKWAKRSDQVCLVLSSAAMIHHSAGLHRLLSYWGGEAIYWRHCESAPALAQKLHSLGQPTMVTAFVDLSDPQAHLIFRSLVHLFVGRALGNPKADAEVFYRAPIPSWRIESIAQPGDAEYDRFPLLPRG